MPSRRNRGPYRAGGPLVLAVLGLVHALIGEAPARADSGKDQAVPSSRASTVGLPPPVAEMRDLILKAVGSGRLEDLEEAVQWNELPPSTGSGSDDRPIEAWLKSSKDGGQDLLATLGGLLAGAPAEIDAGPTAPPRSARAGNTSPRRGSHRFVWPAAAEKPVAQWSATDEADLARFLKPEEIAAMKATGRYASWRLVIGADGTWHAFERLD